LKEPALEKAKQHILLISAIFSGVVAIVGYATDFFKSIRALALQIEELPLWALALVCGSLIFLGLWLLIKWSRRHSRLLRPDSLRLDRENPAHLVGRTGDTNNLFQQCLAKSIVFMEGESGSGKSALVRAGLLPRLKDNKSLLALMLPDLWIDHWDHGLFQSLRIAMIQSGAFGKGGNSDTTEEPSKAAARALGTLLDVERELASLNDKTMRKPLIIFDQFDDYQVRNRERFLPNKTWIDPASLRRENRFWDMIARLVEQDSLHCLFITRSDTAAGLMSVQFTGPVQALRLDRVLSAYIAELLTHLTEGAPGSPVIGDPEAGWIRLRDRILRDISQEDVVLPQQLKVMLGGIQHLKQLNVTQYERAGGASGIEALYVQEQINGTARKVGLEAAQVRAMLVSLIDPLNSSETRLSSKKDLEAAVTRVTGRLTAEDGLEKALNELEGGEIVRSGSDPATGQTVYRLDHSYLTRGVLAAERSANRWQYALADRAKAFENARSLLGQWRALLPVLVQFKLAWERMRGNLRYGLQRRYALISLTRCIPLVLCLLLIGIGWNQYSNWKEASDAQELAQSIWRKFEFPIEQGRPYLSAGDLDGLWGLANLSNQAVREEFTHQLLSSSDYSSRFQRAPDPVVQALVAANPDTRQKVMAISDTAFQNSTYLTKIAAVTILARVGNIEHADWVLDRIIETPPSNELQALLYTLYEVVPTLTQESKESFASKLAEAIRKKPSNSQSLLDALMAFADQLAEPPAFFAETVMEPIKHLSEDEPMGIQGEALFVIAASLQKEEALALATQVVSEVRNTTKRAQLGAWQAAAASLTAQLGPEEGKTLSNQILEAVKTTKDPEQVYCLLDVFGSVRDFGTIDEEISTIGSTVDALKTSGNPEIADLGSQLDIILRPLTEGNLDAAIEVLPRITNAPSFLFTILTKGVKWSVERKGYVVKSEDATKIVDNVSSLGPLALTDPFERIFDASVPYLQKEDVKGVTLHVLRLLNAGVPTFPEVFSKLLAISSYYMSATDVPEFSAQIIAQLKRRQAPRPNVPPPPNVVILRGPGIFADAITAISSKLQADDAKKLAIEIFSSLKAGREEDFGAIDLLPALAAIATQLAPQDARELIEHTDYLLQDIGSPYLVGALVAMAQHIPWSDRLIRYSSVLKYPLVYGVGRNILLNAIKEHPDAASIKSSGDFWAVLEWLSRTQGVDLVTPPQRTSAMMKTL
jgi:hypothetical protein